MKRWVRVALLAVGAALGWWVVDRAISRSYDRGYSDGKIDGDNAGYLAGQRSVECPK